MKPVAARFVVPRQIWGALLGSVVLYVIMLVQLRAKQHAMVFQPSLAMALAPVALVLAVVSVFFPRRVLDVALRKLAIGVTTEPGEMIGSFRESAPMRRVVADPERAVVDALPAFQASLLVGMAIAESISLLGLMLGYLGAPTAVWAPFFVLSFALMATKLPRVETVTRAIERTTGAACKLEA